MHGWRRDIAHEQNQQRATMKASVMTVLGTGSVRVLIGGQPADEHCAGEDEVAGAAQRQGAHFRVERRRRQRPEQVADEVKRSEQPGGGQAELQVAREGRQHDPVGDASDADIQADREHRDGQ
jgi:hypothetical protein